MQINYGLIRKSALVLRAINNSTRQKILDIIAREEKTTVTEIQMKTGLDQSVTSQHLAILRKAGLVTTAKDRRYVYYSLNLEKIEIIQRMSETIV